MIEPRMPLRKPRLPPSLYACATLALSACGSSNAPPQTLEVASSQSAKEYADATSAVEVLLGKDRVAEAEVVARSLAEHYPRDAAAAELFARVLGIRALRDNARAGNPILTEAAHAAARASALSPTDLIRAHAAALLLDRAGRRAEALDRWKCVAVLALDQHDMRFSVAAAIALASQKETETSLRLLRHLEECGASREVLASTGAQVFLASGTPALALDGAREAFLINAENLEYRLLYARVLRLQARSHDAALLLVGLPDATLATPVVAEELALALHEEERFSLAAQAWQRTRVHGVNARYLAEEALARIRANELSIAARVLEELRVAPDAASDLLRVEQALRAAAATP